MELEIISSIAQSLPPPQLIYYCDEILCSSSGCILNIYLGGGGRGMQVQDQL